MRPEQVLGVLKKVLKEKKMTYADLGKEMGLTESGVKKLWRSKDLSLNRLSRIAEVLGLSSHDILRLAQEEPIHEVRLSPKQQRTLLETPILLRVYWRLAIEGQSENDIRQAEGLSTADLDSHLGALERLELVYRPRGGPPQARHRGLYRWSEQGPLVQELNRRWSQGVVLQALSRKQLGHAALHRLVSLQLDEAAREDFEKELHHLIDETLRKSRREKTGPRKKETKPYSLLVAALPMSLIELERVL